MRVANAVPDMQYAMQQSQQALSTALQQVSTGLRVNRPSDDPSASANMVTSLAESANVDQYTKNISSLQSQMQSADSALNSVVTSLNSAITLGTSGATGTVSVANRAAIATQVQGLLSDVIGQANTEYKGVYLFGGSASTTPPFVQASTTYTSAQGSPAVPLVMATPLTSGSTTTVSDASTGETMSFRASAGDTIATLGTAISTAITAGTLSPGTVATIDASGHISISSTNGVVVTSNDPALGAMTASASTTVANAYAYVGNSTVDSVQIGDSTSVKTNLPGSQVFTSGANVVGALNGLITALQGGTGAQIGAATVGITTALNNVGEQRIPLDGSISQLSSEESYLSQETITLTSQQTALVGVNIAEAATNLSQAELTNGAVLAAAAKVLPQTLLDYLK
jgi:flagellar hook-associated protein 3 FlgL